MANLPWHLQTIVDKVCAQGCNRVNHTIERLKQNKAINNATKLDGDERTQVLDELQSIMAVYKRTQN